MNKALEDFSEPAGWAAYGAGTFVGALVLTRIASGPSDRCNTVLGQYMSAHDFKTGAKCLVVNVIMEVHVLILILGGIGVALGVLGMIISLVQSRKDPESE